MSAKNVLHSKSVLYFGSYGSYGDDYARNRIIRKGLQKNGVKIVECTSMGFIFKRYWSLTKCFLKNKDQFESVIVGFPGHLDIPLAFLLGKIFKKKIFFDIFTSLYETYVIDREVVSRNSLGAYFYKFIDWIDVRLCDYVILDTKTHGELYKKLFNLDLKKTIMVYVGSDDNIFYPQDLKEETDVLFYGSFQPLQGVEKIIKAASKLPRVNFKLIGQGQTRKINQNLTKELNLKNVRFVDWMPIEELSKEINKAKIILGIFGDSEKAESVIPNKVYDGIACKKIILTQSSPAFEELFIGISELSVKVPLNLNLSKQIKYFLDNKKVREIYSKKLFDFYKKNLRPEIVVKTLLGKL